MKRNRLCLDQRNYKSKQLSGSYLLLYEFSCSAWTREWCSLETLDVLLYFISSVHWLSEGRKRRKNNIRKNMGSSEICSL